MINRFISVYELLILRKPWLSLAVTFVLIGWLATFIPHFKLDASADSLVLEGDQDLKYFREIVSRYGSEEFLFVVYTPKQDIFSDQSLATIDKLRTELETVDGVSSVMTILDVPLLASPQVRLDELAGGGAIRTLRTEGVDKDLVRDELNTSPLYKDLLTSADGKTTGLQVNLERDEQYVKLLLARERLRELRAEGELSPQQQLELDEATQIFRDYALEAGERQAVLVDTVRGVIDNYRDNAQIFLGGVPMITVDMISFVKSDLVVFGVGILIFIVITMGAIFRRLVWVVLPLLTCLLSATFMLGLITWMDWRMTVISSNFVALLLIITLSITIHLVVRYRELLALDPDAEQLELVKRTAALMMKPCIYTALTTIVAFASLVVSGIRPVIDFGWMMTIGVAAALIISFIVLPAGLLILGKPRHSSSANSDKAATLHFARFTEHHGTVVLWVGALLVLISVVGVSRLEVENRFIDYFDESTEIYQGMELLDAQLGGTIPLEVIIDAAEPEELVPAMNSVRGDITVDNADEGFDEDFDQDFGDEFGGGFEDDFEDDFASEFDDSGASEPSYWFNRAGLSRIEAVHDYLDSLPETGKVMSLATSYKLVRNMTDGIDDIQLALIQRSLPDDIASFAVDPFLDESIDQARITVRVMETSRTLKRDELLAEVNNHLVNELGFKQEQIHLNGMLVLYNNMLQSLYQSQILTIGAVFIAILIMFSILFRSISIALIAIAPNLLAAGLVLGGMGLAGIPLDIMTVTIAAITVGIAVDDTIHYVHRFKAEFSKDQNYVATMYRCHGSIGRAMFYTSIIIIVGFSILALSNFKPSIYFGLLTGAAMFAALIGALLLLPQLIISFKPLGPNVELAPQSNDALTRD